VEVKPSVPYRLVFSVLKNPYKYEKRYCVSEIHGLSRQVSAVSLQCVSAGYWQRALVDESEMIRTKMEKYSRSEMVCVLETPCASAAETVVVSNLYHFTG
jgi:hypothetical protein